MFKHLKKTLKKPGLFSVFFIVGLFSQSQTNFDSLWSVWNDEALDYYQRSLTIQKENSGETGKVNISQSTYELIKDDPAFRFQPRGKVKTKGKGEIEMWFVERVS